MAFATGMMAQDSRVATLQHGTNFRTYYGTDAFISAYADAADGDVITLTEGEFNGCEVTKAITVRGEGMNMTVLKKSYMSISIPQDCLCSLCFEGLTVMDDGVFHIKSTGGAASAAITKCRLKCGKLTVENCNLVIVDSEYYRNGSYYDPFESYSNSSIICINDILITDINGKNFDINNCVIDGTANVTNSIIKNSIIYGVSTIDNTNTTSNCLLKDGSSGFANSWYVKTEPDVNPDPWGEDPETPVLWDELFGEDYHLTDAAAATYIGTDGTQVGIWGGAYPWNETPDYPLVNKLEVKGIHENGKLQVKINVQ